ncbi:single hybrid motif-containing protein [Irpex rosettiformis]|uniref:Single hybrid motif-containing protein n=1 Tax=Irpex rosettiformis TaxID=378272 RepID=A0ACB8UK19_9APHY|nr:single hybrid motif-containing protein [Irpex rosettiformis]
MFSSALRQAARSGLSARVVRRSSVPSALPRQTFVRTLITKKYTEDHEAVVFDDSTSVGTISITDYAQSSLGDVVFVELPSVGTEVKQGDQIGAVESVKAASDIYAPISGTVEAVNSLLADQPGLLNKSPEDEGWLCKIKVSDPAELDNLMAEDKYKEHCENS